MADDLGPDKPQTQEQGDPAANQEQRAAPEPAQSPLKKMAVRYLIGAVAVIVFYFAVVAPSRGDTEGIGFGLVGLLIAAVVCLGILWGMFKLLRHGHRAGAEQADRKHNR